MIEHRNAKEIERKLQEARQRLQEATEAGADSYYIQVEQEEIDEFMTWKVMPPRYHVCYFSNDHIIEICKTEAEAKEFIAMQEDTEHLYYHKVYERDSRTAVLDDTAYIYDTL